VINRCFIKIPNKNGKRKEKKKRKKKGKKGKGETKKKKKKKGEKAVRCTMCKSRLKNGGLSSTLSIVASSRVPIKSLHGWRG